MRNIFDQYDHPENRLTHALLATLSNDKRLLSGFIKLVKLKCPSKTSALKIVEQSLVGELESSEDEAERRGLPDGWIYDESGWCMLIESKISSMLKSDQLVRHYRTAERCGFTNINVLAIEAVPAKVQSFSWLSTVTWVEIYEWLVKQKSSSTWSDALIEYFEIAERKMTDSGYLTEGSLTVFTGIHFNQESPYNYLEAKRLLELIIEEVKDDREFCKKAMIDPNLNGRGAITGTKGLAVWDFLRLKGTGSDENFTSHPHFTFGLNHQRIHTAVTIPNGIQRHYRNNLKQLSYDEFVKLVQEVVKNMKPLIQLDPGFAPLCTAVQRRYPSQKSKPFHDALLEFDPRTAFASDSSVKMQSQWLQAAFDAFCNKNSNYQFQIGSAISYEKSSQAASRNVLKLIKDTWLACSPFVDCLTK